MPPSSQPGGRWKPASQQTNGGSELENRPFIALWDGRLQLIAICLAGLLLLALFYTLYFARDFVLPLILASLLAFPLAPLVRALSRVRVPESVGAGVVLLFFLMGMFYMAYRVYDPAREWMTRLPTELRAMESELRDFRKPVEEVSEAAKQVEEQVQEITATDDDEPMPVVVGRPPLSDVLLSGTRRVLAVGLLTMVLLYFLLASGDWLLLKVVRVLPTLEDKKKAVEISRQVEKSVSSYLFTVTAINVGLGIAVGVAMYLLGMPNPLLWGVMAALFNFVPYLGAIAGVAVLTLAALVSFDSTGRALTVPATYYLLTACEGWFITPLILGRRLTLNPLAILVSLIFWAWLWGLPGALLAVPILAALKIVCDQSERLAPVGEFLGR